jgi:hypothetical protein
MLPFERKRRNLTKDSSLLNMAAGFVSSERKNGKPQVEYFESFIGLFQTVSFAVMTCRAWACPELVLGTSGLADALLEAVAVRFSLFWGKSRKRNPVVR